MSYSENGKIIREELGGHFGPFHYVGKLEVWNMCKAIA